MARSYLQSRQARRLVVEIDYVGELAPSTSAMNHVEKVLREVLDKPDGVSVARGSSIPSGLASWSEQDLRMLESAHRGSYSAGATATIWVVYVNGSFSKNESALGGAYSASSFAVFRDRIDDATTAIINAARIERAVLTHEIGHLLSLVNIGYKSAIDHEDPQHPHHSRNDESVMYWAVDDLALESLLRRGPPDEFDGADRADLEALKRG